MQPKMAKVLPMPLATLSHEIDEETWFDPRRCLGPGWTPVTWQGGVPTNVFIAMLVAVSGHLAAEHHMFIATFILIAAFAAFCRLTGGAPEGRELFDGPYCRPCRLAQQRNT